MLKDHLMIDYGRPASFEECLLRFESVGSFFTHGLWYTYMFSCLPRRSKRDWQDFRWVLDESHYLSIYLLNFS